MLSTNRPGRTTSRPVLQRCYLCGNEFGSASIGIHIPQCYNKKISQWQQGNPSTRGPKPKHPETVNWKGEGLSKTENQEVQAKEFEAGLSPCPNCGRTFLPDRLPIHLKGCKPSGSHTSQKRKPSPPNSNESGGTGSKIKRSSGPPVLPRCYLCGQQFGTMSIGIHVPQCYAKKMAQWEAGDVRTRGQAPKHPDSVNWKGEGQTKEQQSEEQFKEFVSNLELCPNCGRKFLADRLIIHLRSCKPGHTSKPVQVHSQHSEKATDQPPPSTGPKDQLERGEIRNDLEAASNPKKNSDPQAFLDPKRNRVPSNQDMESCKRCCASCGTIEYEASAKFCRDCGHNFSSKSIADPCAHCGEVVAEGSRFCGTCGQPVPGAAANERAPTESSSAASKTKVAKCPACEALCGADGNFCDNCGAALGDTEPVEKELVTQHSSAKILYCEKCKEDYDDNTAVFCEECGDKLVERESARELVTSTTMPTKGKTSNCTQEEAEKKKRLITNSTDTNLPLKKTSLEKVSDPTTTNDDFVPLNLIPCEHCGRRFAEETLAKHVKFCATAKKRPVFNMTKQRLEGNDIPKVAPTKKENVEAPPKRDWKAESENFRKTLREARKVDRVLKSGGNIKDLPPPTYSENPDYVQCQHCQRRFAPDVAARHIPRCATTINRPKAPPKRK